MKPKTKQKKLRITEADYMLAQRRVQTICLFRAFSAILMANIETGMVNTITAISTGTSSCSFL